VQLTTSDEGIPRSLEVDGKRYAVPVRREGRVLRIFSNDDIRDGKVTTAAIADQPIYQPWNVFLEELRRLGAGEARE
jgi:hypothetical protein